MMALNKPEFLMNTYAENTNPDNRPRHVTEKRTAECPLRKPAQHVKKSIWAIYMTVMMDVFSHSSWNGW